MIALQWIGGSLLAIVALALVVLFAASVLAILDQPRWQETVVSAIISGVLFLMLAAAALGAFALITAALGM